MNIAYFLSGFAKKNLCEKKKRQKRKSRSELFVCNLHPLSREISRASRAFSRKSEMNLDLPWYSAEKMYVASSWLFFPAKK